MLTKRQNFLETIRGGKPDRYVNQFEAFAIQRETPFSLRNPSPARGQLNVVDAWGVTRSWPEGTPGPFPVHDDAHIVIKDITRWRDFVTPPNIIFPDEEWAPYVKKAQAVDRSEYFVTAMVAPGVFERCHYLMEISNCLINFYEEPECMHELIDMLTDWELRWAAELCKHLKPDAILHHDDWGSRQTTFLSPEMFREFFLPAYKKIYGYYKTHGVEVIVHHSDSYAATLVPSMIEMGIDVWQGCMRSNNIPQLLKTYGGKISFMCGIDNADVDREDWTPELVKAAVHQAIEEGSRLYFIPCAAGGGPGSCYPGVYECITSEIEQINRNLQN
ncbi:MAG TPA: uroporphyrinogen decarboxylase [Clostridiales bacterium]|jgi:hypothetical protein|nr:uroporphyrinogen decarboxylase [Clostridiales bacterium]